VFYVEDATWGGLVNGDAIIAYIGGDGREQRHHYWNRRGEIARDELMAARRLGKKVRFIPADMDHQKARESARKKGLPEPADFRGAAHTAF